LATALAGVGLALCSRSDAKGLDAGGASSEARVPHTDNVPWRQSPFQTASVRDGSLSRAPYCRKAAEQDVETLECPYLVAVAVKIQQFVIDQSCWSGSGGK
jgi:hypothetical protein